MVDDTMVVSLVYYVMKKVAETRSLIHRLNVENMYQTLKEGEE